MEKWEKLKGFSASQITEMQSKHRQAFFSQEIMQRHPYYSKVFKDMGFSTENITDLSLQGLPFTTREDLAGAHDQEGRLKRFQISPPPPEERSAEPKKKSFFGKLLKGAAHKDSPDPKAYRVSQVLYAGDFASSAIPLVYTAYDLENLKEAGRRLFDLWGLTRDDTTVNAFSYAPHLGFWQVFYAGLEKGSTVLQSGGGRILGAEKILTALENMKAEVLFASPLYAKHLLQVALKFKSDLSNLTTIVLGMEPASAEIMARIGELMDMAGCAGNRVLRSFSLTEAKTGWGECPDGEGLHIHPDHHDIEVIDPDSGKVLGEREAGEIVLTHLDAKGTCLIRYRTGLRTTGGITSDACPRCGSSLPRITGELEELKNIVSFSTPDRGKITVNLEGITRRLDQEKTLLLWQGSVGTGAEGDAALTISASWFMKDDSAAPALAAELGQKFGVDIDFTTDSYTNLMNSLMLETGFTSKRWVQA